MVVISLPFFVSLFWFYAICYPNITAYPFKTTYLQGSEQIRIDLSQKFVGQKLQFFSK